MAIPISRAAARSRTGFSPAGACRTSCPDTIAFAVPNALSDAGIQHSHRNLSLTQPNARTPRETCSCACAVSNATT